MLLPEIFWNFRVVCFALPLLAGYLTEYIFCSSHTGFRLFRRLRFHQVHVMFGPVLASGFFLIEYRFDLDVFHPVGPKL
jgi:hypothetical protein